MSTTRGITRRAFLGVAGLFAAAGAAGPARALAAVGTGSAALLEGERARIDVLAHLVHDRRSAARVGLAYLRDVPAEADARCLLDAVCGPAPPADPRTLRTEVARRLRADFLAERLVSVDGWVLSRTEARLCALSLLA